MAENNSSNNNQIEKSRLQSAVLDYQRSKKFIKCGIIAIGIVSVLMVVSLLVGWGTLGGGLFGGGTGDGPVSDGAFTVKIDPKEGEKSIGISEAPNSSNPTDTLKTTGINNAWNITLTDIPTDTVDSDVGGSKNGQNYFAYTLFLKNTGSVALDYNELLTLTANVKDAVKAVRIMIYRDGTPVTYASPAADGTKEQVACDESFTGDVNLISIDHQGLEAGQVVRYTIVIWFEGNDPECVDDILGGTVELSLGFKII